MGSWCMRATHAYKGPLIAISIGVGFMLVGAVPVAITFGMNTKGSATIIGVGFIGFGLLVVLPGICWCIVRRIASFRCCHAKQDGLHLDDEYDTPDDDLATIHRKPSSSSTKVCYIMADNRCKIAESGAPHHQCTLDEHELEEDCSHQDNGNVRLTR